MIEYPQIDPVAFSLGPLKVHWYGLMYLLAFFCGHFLLKHRAKKADAPFTEQEASDLIFYSALGIILGGRIGYFLFYTPLETWLSNPLSIFKIWQGGMSFHGGLLGVIGAVWLWSRHIKKPFLQITDFGAPVVPLGIAFGRLGNFIGNELWGRESPDLAWGMVFPGAGDIPRHPSQLYEMMLEGFLLFAFLWVISQKARPRGLISGLFLLGYGGGRFLVEFFREPDAHIGFLAFNWITMGHLLCTPMILGGLILIGFSQAQSKSRN